LAIDPSAAVAVPPAGSQAPGTRARVGPALSVMDSAQLDFHTTPFRAERFYELYRPAIARPVAYGASGYLFYQVEEDPNHFVHLSFWEDRRGFQRWWLSDEMQAVRQRVDGLYGQPVLPYWNVVLERG
jgi:heme-degrading monooxygenase HmoA